MKQGIWYHCMNYSIWTISCFVLCCKMFSGYSSFFFLTQKNGNSTFHGQLAYHVTKRANDVATCPASKFYVLLKRRRSLRSSVGCSRTFTHSHIRAYFDVNFLHAIHVTLVNLTSSCDGLPFHDTSWMAVVHVQLCCHVIWNMPKYFLTLRKTFDIFVYLLY